MSDAVRLKHALMEMKARGLLKREKLTAVQRFMLRFGRPVPLEYASFGRIFVMVAVFAAIPFTAMLWPAFAADEDLPGIVGLLTGLGSGVVFGVAFAAFLRWQHKEMRLTPWDALDEPPGDAPADAKTAAEIEAMIPKRLWR